MKMPSSPKVTLRSKGFNLIEAAVVLAVVGLVIGGIWVAAAAVNRNRIVAQLSSATLQITSGMTELYKNVPGGTASANITVQMMAAGVIPGDYTYNSGAPCDISGHDAAMVPGSSRVGFCVGDPGTSSSRMYILNIIGLNQSECVSYLSGIQNNALLKTINFVGADIFSTLPVSISNLVQECGWSSSDIYLIFQIG